MFAKEKIKFLLGADICIDVSVKEPRIAMPQEDKAFANKLITLS